MLLSRGIGFLLLVEDGIEVVIEVLCGVFGDDLRCGDVLGVLDWGRHVADVFGFGSSSAFIAFMRFL